MAVLLLVTQGDHEADLRGLDFRLTVKDIIPEAEAGLARWFWWGTHRAELSGVAPSGNQFTISGVTIAGFAGGKFSEIEDHLRVNLLGQICGARRPPDVPCRPISRKWPPRSAGFTRW
jgi:hypothetical protein